MLGVASNLAFISVIALFSYLRVTWGALWPPEQVRVRVSAQMSVYFKLLPFSTLIVSVLLLFHTVTYSSIIGSVCEYALILLSLVSKLLLKGNLLRTHSRIMKHRLNQGYDD